MITDSKGAKVIDTAQVLRVLLSQTGLQRPDSQRDRLFSTIKVQPR